MKFIDKTNLEWKYLALHIVAPFPILISEHLQITTKPIVHGWPWTSLPRDRRDCSKKSSDINKQKKWSGKREFAKVSTIFRIL